MMSCKEGVTSYDKESRRLKPKFFKNKADFLSVSTGSTKHTSNWPSAAHCGPSATSLSVNIGSPKGFKHVFEEYGAQATKARHYVEQVQGHTPMIPFLPSLCLDLFQKWPRPTLSTPFLPYFCSKILIGAQGTHFQPNSYHLSVPLLLRGTRGAQL